MLKSNIWQIIAMKQKIITNAKHTGLEGLGLKPIHLTEDIFDSMIDLVIENRDYINQDCILPSAIWSRRRITDVTSHHNLGWEIKELEKVDLAS